MNMIGMLGRGRADRPRALHVVVLHREGMDLVRVEPVGAPRLGLGEEDHEAQKLASRGHRGEAELLESPKLLRRWAPRIKLLRVREPHVAREHTEQACDASSRAPAITIFQVQVKVKVVHLQQRAQQPLVVQLEGLELRYDEKRKSKQGRCAVGSLPVRSLNGRATRSGPSQGMVAAGGGADTRGAACGSSCAVAGTAAWGGVKYSLPVWLTEDVGAGSSGAPEDKEEEKKDARLAETAAAMAVASRAVVL